MRGVGVLGGRLAHEWSCESFLLSETRQSHFGGRRVSVGVCGGRLAARTVRAAGRP